MPKPIVEFNTQKRIDTEKMVIKMEKHYTNLSKKLYYSKVYYSKVY